MTNQRGGLPMKQTKKLTRGQREILHRNGVDTTNCRLVVETKEYIDYQCEDGSIKRFLKGDAK